MGVRRMIGLALSLLAAGCAEKESAADSYSAYALSNTTLKGSFALSRLSAIEAQERSIAACEAAAGDGRPCRQVLWFTQACGAVALGVRLKTDVADWAEATRKGELLQIGAGVGADAAAACADALRICVDAGGVNCNARDFACMDSGVAGACPAPVAQKQTAPPVSADNRNFIAYAYSANKRTGSFATSARSANEARDQALADCGVGGVGDCDALGSFEADCAAIAAASGARPSVAAGADPGAACRSAQGACARGGKTCNALTYACIQAEPGFCRDLDATPATSEARAAHSGAHGAIAIAVDGARVGGYVSYGQKDRQSAETAALRGCRDEEGADDCKVELVFENACGAWATTDNGGYGTGWGRDRAEACGWALTSCRESNPAGCEADGFACSPGGQTGLCGAQP